jgi:hypothetical protein
MNILKLDDKIAANTHVTRRVGIHFLAVALHECLLYTGDIDRIRASLFPLSLLGLSGQQEIRIQNGGNGPNASSRTTSLRSSTAAT